MYGLQLDGHPRRVAIVSTYPPRRCGLAAFSQNLRSALSLAAPDWRVDVVAVDRGGLDYGDEVLAVIDQDSAQSYLDAATVIAMAGVDIVIIEHEYGIFGGVNGRFVLDLTAQLRRRAVPYVVTLHTVTATPTPGQAAVLRELCAGAVALTVFTCAAGRTLVGTGLVDPARVEIVPHGAPAVLGDPATAPPPGPALAAALHGWADAPVLTTFGLLGPGKGLAQVIAALPALRGAHPDIRYVIAGATHPEVLRGSGEAYRHGLMSLARRLGVSASVDFIDAFLSESELAHLLARTTLYVTPYHGLEQSSSGTLAFAIAAGCAVVSTPYQYAREMLGGRADATPGVLVPEGDPAALAAAVSSLLAQPGRLARARAAARLAGAGLAWPTVAARYAAVFAAASPPRPRGRPLPAPIGAARYQLRLDHLAALVDDVGIIQFSRGTAPDPRSGYCVDDAARLAIVAAQLCRIAPLDARAWLGTAQRFLRAALAHDGMHNVLDEDRTWRDEAHHGDHVGRTLWSAGAVLSGGAGVDPEHRGHAQALLDDVWSMAMATGSLKTIAYGLLGLTMGAWLPDGARAVVRDAAYRLDGAIDADPRWPWFEGHLTYDNARLPQALLAAGRFLGERALIGHALSTLDWYLGQVGLAGPGPLVNVGNTWRGKAATGPHDPPGDEQPLEAAALVEALVGAWQATGRSRYARLARRAFAWFLGANVAGTAVYDAQTGGCHDGLSSGGINANEGAESTLAYYQALLALDAAGLAEACLPTDQRVGIARVGRPAADAGPRVKAGPHRNAAAPRRWPSSRASDTRPHRLADDRGPNLTSAMDSAIDWG
jgi:glycosyltransferase involved in cell wall biosynthesis